MMVHYRKDENGNIILSEYMFNRLMKQAHNKEKENRELKKEIERLNNIINKTKQELLNKKEIIEELNKMLKGKED